MIYERWWDAYTLFQCWWREDSTFESRGYRHSLAYPKRRIFEVALMSVLGRLPNYHLSHSVMSHAKLCIHLHVCEWETSPGYSWCILVYENVGFLKRPFFYQGISHLKANLLYTLQAIFSAKLNLIPSYKISSTFLSLHLYFYLMGMT